MKHVRAPQKRSIPIFNALWSYSLPLENNMKIVHLTWLLFMVALWGHGADISGSWRASFESQIGQQDYVYTFTQEGETVSGKAHSEVNGVKQTLTIEDGKVVHGTLSFIENFAYQGNTIRIAYTGKLEGDTLTLTRAVGDFATEEVVARRQPQTPPNQRAEERPRRSGRGGFGGPITLGPDDRQILEEPSSDIHARREGISRGKLEMISYASKSVGTTRNLHVYTPPDYHPDQRYPVLYLLHGIGGDETEWHRFATIDQLFDNLIADGKAKPMIVVMPNGRAQKNDRAEGNVFASAPAFAAFEKDLMEDVIPTIHSRYAVHDGREYRALAGLSMGGGQSLNFGLGHLDTFAWVGGFSSAPNTKAPEELIPDMKQAKQQIRLLYLSCGNKDGLIRISQGVHAYLKAQGVPHLWNVDSHAHDATHWRNNLYHFAQKIF